MPIPGVAGAGVEGATRADLPVTLCCTGVALCEVNTGAIRTGATVGACATATVRCDVAAPRSTQRSGSSWQPVPAMAGRAETTPAVMAAATRIGQIDFTTARRERVRAFGRMRLYIGRGLARGVFLSGAGR